MADSPSASDAGQQKDQGQISFRFCRECSNMLYPKEDRMNNQLMFACRTCQFSEPAPSSCVFRNQLYTEVGETAGVTQDVGSDPTVGSSELDFDPVCTLCGEQIKCLICGVNDCRGMVCYDMSGRDRSNSDKSTSDSSSTSQGGEGAASSGPRRISGVTLQC